MGGLLCHQVIRISIRRSIPLPPILSCFRPKEISFFRENSCAETAFGACTLESALFLRDHAAHWQALREGLLEGQLARLESELAHRRIAVWSGDSYACELVDALGLRDRGGVVRAGIVRHTTVDDVDALLHAVGELTS